VLTLAEPCSRNVPLASRIKERRSGFAGKGSMTSVSVTLWGTVFNMRSMRAPQVDKKWSFDAASLGIELG
jgi:hypothetical protein